VPEAVTAVGAAAASPGCCIKHSWCTSGCILGCMPSPVELSLAAALLFTAGHCCLVLPLRALLQQHVLQVRLLDTCVACTLGLRSSRHRACAGVRTGLGLRSAS
jgi:hypothetical protein